MRVMIMAALVFATATAPAFAQSRNRSSVTPGVVCPQSFEGQRNMAAVPVIARTDHVPAVQGFGFTLQAALPVAEGTPVVISVVRPKGDGTMLREDYSTSAGTRGASTFVYRFEKAEEAAAGRWVITARAGEAVLYEQRMNVVVPRQGDGILRACGL